MNLGRKSAILVATGVILFMFHVLGQQAPQGNPAVAGRGGGGGRFTQPEPIDFDNHSGWTSMFDGSTLKGWDGSSVVWRVENGAIVGESKPEKPAGTTYIIWEGGEPKNFELKTEVKLEGAGANSGIQYRSARTTQVQGGPAPNPQFAKWNLKGYQADFDFANRFSGQLYEQGTPRGIIAWRGQVVRAEQGKKPRLLSVLGDPDALKGYIKVNDWNQMHVIARGNTMIHMINGHVMSVFIDDDPSMAVGQGVIGLQIEGGGNVKVSFRNLWLKNL
jgi:3-keto-disaccharide hydrolase